MAYKGKRLFGKERKVRIILHSDLNNFYASVEEMKNPELKGKPIIVTGSKEDRHGIVLAKNTLAKSFGIKTGDVYWKARQKCKDVIEVPVSMPDYVKVSNRVREIYKRFTDKIEPFGIDECWLDVTDTARLFGGGEAVAESIRVAVKEEIGVTVSVGVSFNKVFAKLASDMKKPDAITVVSVENYKEKIWKLPVEDLLYVGRSTKEKLNRHGVYTIGDLAKVEEKHLSSWLGKWGNYLYAYANGHDISPVLAIEEAEDVKSIGNSMTHYKDLHTTDEVRVLILTLAESVASRLREEKIGKACTVKLGIIDDKLNRYGKQAKTEYPTSSALEIAKTAYKLFDSLYDWKNAVRGVGVTVCDFTHGSRQLNMFEDGQKEAKNERLDGAIENIRARFGNGVIQRASILQDEKLYGADIKGNRIYHKEREDKKGEHK